MWSIYNKQSRIVVAKARTEENAAKKTDRLNRKAGFYKFNFCPDQTPIDGSLPANKA